MGPVGFRTGGALAGTGRWTGFADELEQVMTRFVILPKYGAETLALWTFHTLMPLS